ncbi:Heteroproteinous nuclear ribonucleoprotein L [Clonorchis sinensis]|uniref:Heteroproteinous nuclear ribonucleoprotein L n=2 Tax=Clonorchis sinensis TaxID=79923 RepID=A0A8T1N0H2_CLOSI|nr:Heteroproteinous nuclear ribonucleoprotein L [Clonorchis sinensis]GAA34297.1 heterogeneous nuclear ribonucleoprotein L [Clonorchis sinensis]
MDYPAKRSRNDTAGASTAQFYNSTGTVPSNIQLKPDIYRLITTHPNCTIIAYELPDGCSENDLFAIFNQFGEIKHTKLVCSGKAGLVQFSEISSPTRLVHMAKINPFYIGSNHVCLEFSAESIAPLLVSQIDTGRPRPPSEEQTKILLLDITAADYPITVDVIRSICQPHGKVLRIFIGKKNIDRSVEALVELDTSEDARKVKEQIDGADIYYGCCTLKVTYSKISRVHVTKNDSESWDFSCSGELLNGGSGHRTLLGYGQPACSQTSQPPVPASTVHPYSSYLPSSEYKPEINVTNTPAAQVSPPCPPSLTPPAAAPALQPQPALPMPVVPQTTPPMPYYSMPCYPVPQMYGPSPPITYMQPPYCSSYATPVTTSVTPSNKPAPKVLTDIKVLPTPPPVHQVNSDGIGIGHATTASSAPSHRVSKNDCVFECVEGVVIMACNLPPTMNCDHLFNLLCPYGNIARIRFLKSRRGSAMVQLGTAEAAEFVHQYYNGRTVFGHKIRFSSSKQPQLVEYPNLGTLDDGSPVMKNYIDDPNNRFRNPAIAAKSRITAPSRTLHFFNLPLNISLQDVCRIFTDCGAVSPPRLLLFNQKPGQMTSLGLAEWDTLAEALEAMVLANHRPVHVSGLVNPFHLKLAFSPNPIAKGFGNSLIQYPAPPFAETPAGYEYKDDTTETSVEEEDLLLNDQLYSHCNGTSDNNTPSKTQAETEESQNQSPSSELQCSSDEREWVKINGG